VRDEIYASVMFRAFKKAKSSPTTTSGIGIHRTAIDISAPHAASRCRLPTCSARYQLLGGLQQVASRVDQMPPADAGGFLAVEPARGHVTGGRMEVRHEVRDVDVGGEGAVAGLLAKAVDGGGERVVVVEDGLMERCGDLEGGGGGGEAGDVDFGAQGADTIVDVQGWVAGVADDCCDGGVDRRGA